jgi:DNA-binding GntR family transcriptional regulator
MADPASHADDRSDAQVVHDRLRQAILRHEVPADQPVSQVQLAKQLGVSRTPLREALRLLEREGLVEARPNRQVRVAPVSPEDLEELYGMRIVLEAFACNVTVPQLSAADLDAMDATLLAMDRFAREEDFEAWDEPHRRFHRLLRCHAGARLERLLDDLTDHAERYRRLNLSEPRAWSQGAAEHAAIRDACRDGDAALASERLGTHLSKTALTVLVMLDPERDPVQVRSALRFSRHAR